MSAAILLFWLLVGHAVADYPLQGDFLAKAKNAWLPIADIPWWIAMSSHCAIHAGAVALITHNYLFASLEFGIHFVIDVLKCSGRTSFATDQTLHLICKIAWVLL